MYGLPLYTPHIDLYTRTPTFILPLSVEQINNLTIQRDMSVRCYFCFRRFTLALSFCLNRVRSMSKCLRYLIIMGGIACLTATLDARARKIDLGTRSNLLEQTVELDVQRPEMHSTLSGQGQRMEFGQWHREFSSIGKRRSPLENTPLKEKEVRSRKMVPFERMEMEMYRDNREMAAIRNWNNMREIVMAEKFSRGEITSPQGRKMQQAVDDLSLRDFNRYQTMRNKTDEGVPVHRAGSEGAIELKESRISVEIKD